MKLVITALIALTSASAFAGALDAKQYNYEDEAYFPKVAEHCVDGNTQMFVESINGFDRYVNVIRTCVNGVYYPRQITVAKPCQEGAVAFWSVGKPVNDNQATQRFVCVGGKYKLAK